ncbi:hypothetical protein HDV00_010565 [Rhizophlyctis rosea]|nr:hypothetical protein HDV00_010565 [Rhizophlyctis rosea]
MAMSTGALIGIAISSAVLLVFALYLLWRTNRARKARADITDLESPQNSAHTTGTRNGKQSFTQKRMSRLGDFGSLASKSLIEIGSKGDTEFGRARSISVGAPMGSRASSKASESSRGGLSLSDCPVRSTSLSPVASGGTGNMPQLSGTETAVEAYRRRGPDELTLRIGDPVSIYKSYSDGWAVGMNWRTGLSGCFPLVAVYPEAASLFPASGDEDDAPRDIVLKGPPSIGESTVIAGIHTNTPLAPPPWKGGKPVHLTDPSPRPSVEAQQALMEVLMANADAYARMESMRAAEGVAQPEGAHLGKDGRAKGT